MVTHVTINKDGSVDLENSPAVDKDLLAMMQAGEAENPFAELRQQLQEEGFEVTDYDEGDFTGIKAHKHFAKPAEAVKLFPARLEKGPNVAEKAGFSGQKHFFRTTYRFAGDIDLTIPESAEETQEEGEDESAAIGSALGRAFLNQMRIRLLVTLPVKPERHNADKVADNGRTLEWELRPGKKYHLEFRCSLLNVANLLAAIGGATGLTAVAVLAAVLVARRRKARLDRGEGQT
ncbi:MAG: hypothetical protein GX493_02350 [Firmicutes bacterium]|nr:hypothetical protein [Bacillota bacterium]